MFPEIFSIMLSYSFLPFLAYIGMYVTPKSITAAVCMCVCKCEKKVRTRGPRVMLKLVKMINYDF